MRRILFSAILGAAVGLTLAATPVRAGEDIEALVRPCAGCHGTTGVPNDPKINPIIWGQQASYLMKQLRDFRNGNRVSTIMAPLAQRLAEPDLRKIAAYFAAKPWPAQHATAVASTPTAPKGIAQCQPCHQSMFDGGPPAPRLAGLSYEYLIQAMRKFAADERTNSLDMPKFMQMLTVSEREAIARYISAL